MKVRFTFAVVTSRGGCAGVAFISIDVSDPKFTVGDDVYLASLPIRPASHSSHYLKSKAVRLPLRVISVETSDQSIRIRLDDVFLAEEESAEDLARDFDELGIDYERATNDDLGRDHGARRIEL
jgi:hypothetical protein